MSKRLLTPFDFGAVGDGVHDDLPAMEMARDRLFKLGGGTLWFPKPDVVYRTTRSLILGSRFVDEAEIGADYRKLIYDHRPPSFDTDAFAESASWPSITLAGESSAIWGDFSASTETAIVYYGVRLDIDNKINPAEAEVGGLVFLGQSAMTGSPPVRAATSTATRVTAGTTGTVLQVSNTTYLPVGPVTIDDPIAGRTLVNILSKDSGTQITIDTSVTVVRGAIVWPDNGSQITNPAGSKQMGLFVPGSTKLSVLRNYYIGLDHALVSVDNYNGLIERNYALACARGFHIARHNAGHIRDLDARNMSVRGALITGQQVNVVGFHTEECQRDLWIPQGIGGWSVDLGYLENTTGSTDHSIVLGDPDDLTQVVAQIDFRGGHSFSVSTEDAISYGNTFSVTIDKLDCQRNLPAYSFSARDNQSRITTIDPAGVLGDSNPDNFPETRYSVKNVELAEPEFGTYRLTAMQSARLRLGHTPNNAVWITPANYPVGTFPHAATGTGASQDALSSGVVDGAWLFINPSSGAGTELRYLTGGPKTNTTTEFFFEVTLELAALASDFDLRCGFRHPTSAFAVEVMVGLARANSTTKWSLETEDGATYGTSTVDVSIAATTFQCWWRRGTDGKIWFRAGTETPISISDADLSGSAKAGNMLPAVYFNGSTSTQRIGYFLRGLWCWS